jgi:hypothetical protein
MIPTGETWCTEREFHWSGMWCSVLAYGDQRFEGACCLHHQDNPLFLVYNEWWIWVIFNIKFIFRKILVRTGYFELTSCKVTFVRSERYIWLYHSSWLPLWFDMTCATTDNIWCATRYLPSEERMVHVFVLNCSFMTNCIRRVWSKNLCLHNEIFV